MGRMLDTLYAAGVTEVFLEVAREARQAFPIPVRALHADATSFHVHGQYESLGEEVGAIRVTHGYSRDHRPELKQWVMNLVCADTGGIPLLFSPGDGNQKEARAREEEEGLRRRVARAEGEAEKALGRLLSRRFACEADARRTLAVDEEASGKLPYHRLVYLGVQEERRRGRVGRPRKGEAPLSVSYRLLARLEVDEGKLERARRGLGRFLLATDVLDREALPAGEMLKRYKDQTRTVERGFRFLKDPLFFTGSTFLKRPERVMALGMVMALALLVYALGEWALRRGLAETGSSLPDQKGRPTQRPTLRWVFQLFIWVRLVELEGRPLVLNLAPHHETAVRLLGAQRYYLLE
jgi:transposase